MGPWAPPPGRPALPHLRGWQNTVDMVHSIYYRYTMQNIYIYIYIITYHILCVEIVYSIDI